MAILERVELDLKRAMLTSNDDLKNATRVILGEVPRLNKKVGEEVNDDEMIKLIKKLVKSEEEVMSLKGSGDSKYLEILYSYLPTIPSDDEIKNWMKDNIDFSSLKNPGMAVPKVIAHFGAVVDGKKIIQLIKDM